jgi:glycosyltransferase involved in cell wall biosynthesis
MTEKKLQQKTIWYFLPDYNQPSWGVGMLYHHVRLLNKNGFNAILLHERSPFMVDWLELMVPTQYLEDGELTFSKDDIIVVPEILAGDKRLFDIHARKIVFIQNCFSIFLGLNHAQTYRELKYEHAFTYLPHLHEIIKQHFNIETTDIPPFVAPFFYLIPDALNQSERKKQIILFPKTGIPDYDIVQKLLSKKLTQVQSKNSGWGIIELRNKSHREVSDIMKESAIFVSTNTHEAFNSSVPEAMAAGCIVVCYEAYGPKDFLEDKQNAFVFPNNHAYPLIDKLFSLIDNYDNIISDLAELRATAYRTACSYTIEKTEKALVSFFRSF